MKYLYIISLGVLFMSCDPEGVKSTNGKNPIPEKPVSKELKITPLTIDSLGRAVKFDNGLEIHWVQEGSGEKLGEGKLVEVDYAVYLKSGKLAHSNKQVGMSSAPFMIGYGMQTEAWDLALQELKVGDSAEIIMPAAIARGEKGYRQVDAKTGKVIEIIPPNSDLVLKIRVLKENKPTRTVDGNKVWKIYGNKNEKKVFDVGKEIEFQCNAYTPSERNFINTVFKMKLEDSGLVPGLKKALVGSKKADKMFVLVPSAEGYGTKGYQKLVKPNEDIFYIIFVIDVK